MQFESYILRPLAATDLQAYFQLVQNNRKRLEDFFAGTVSKTQTFADTQNFLQEMLEKAAHKTLFPFVIEDTTLKTLAGFLDLKNIDWNIPKAEIGFYIDAQYAGKGITTQALAYLVQYAFQAYGFQKMFLRTHESNFAAQKVAEKCGFEIEGKLRREYKTTSGEIVDLLYYGKLA